MKTAKRSKIKNFVDVYKFTHGMFIVHMEKGTCQMSTWKHYAYKKNHILKLELLPTPSLKLRKCE